MSKRCPPGVICIENMTVTFVIIIVIIVSVFMFKLSNNTDQASTTVIPSFNIPSLNIPSFNIPSLNILPNNSLSNPYDPPLRDNSVFSTNSSDPRGIPININTRAVDAEYRQVGILTRSNGPETILPLMGRPLYVSRDKWNFYTMKDSNTMVKLPVTFKNKSCTNEYGCDNLYNGDVVYVEGYNDTFKVTMYDNQVMQYIPYL